MSRFSLLAVAILLEVLGTLSLRAMDGLAQPWWLLGVVAGYAGAFVGVARVLQLGMPVGVAYGIWAACGVALASVGGALLFGDRLTLPVVAGIGLVVAGVLVVEFGARRGAGAHAGGG